ncbi:YfgM family protein [Novilysobacter erysipheiresistens]|uniref:Ancillary SecYEG translocon subunit n=1 Tax=Novilysobacter erysipheiresistens TaxID=1749332 RepID=A0ABU7YVN1_9GAMM
MAIDDPLDEHEQSERVLEWLRANGAGLIGGIVLGLAAIGGWKWWQAQQQQQQLAKADQYQAAVEAIETGNGEGAAKVQALGEGVFANLAALELAASQAEANQNTAAIETLRGITPGNPAIADIVNQRLARLLIDTDQADAALALLDNASTPAALQIRGDAQYALGQADAARESYQQALTRLDVASPLRRMLELKLTEVGGSADRTEAKS